MARAQIIVEVDQPEEVRAVADWFARWRDRLMPDRMHRFHQIWLERLADRAAAGGPSA